MCFSNTNRTNEQQTGFFCRVLLYHLCRGKSCTLQGAARKINLVISKTAGVTLRDTGCFEQPPRATLVKTVAPHSDIAQPCRVALARDLFAFPRRAVARRTFSCTLALH